MTLLDETYSYRGLVFGGPETGCAVWVNRVEGFAGFDVRSSDSDLPRGDGAIRGLDFVAPRTVAFELCLAELEDRDGSIYEALWASVRAAFQPSRQGDYELVFKRPGQPEQLLRCRPIQLTRSEQFRNYNRIGVAPIVLRAADPRIYSTTLHRSTVPIDGTTLTTGDNIPAAQFPFDFGGGGPRHYVANNAGNADAYPMIRFFGPRTGTVTAVRLENTATGQVLSIGSSISAGSILEADMDAAATGASKLIVALDGVTRYRDWALPRDTFALVPGDNTIKFTVSGTSTDAICQLTWRDTWIS